MRRLSFVTLLLIMLQTTVLAMESRAGSVFTGQWVWSTRDAKIFHDSRRSVPGLVPSVWVSTVCASEGAVVQRLANPPNLAGYKGQIAVVVRFDDSFTTAWKTKTPMIVARELDERLTKLTGILVDTGADIMEIQLDYDCPVRHLKDWSVVVRKLKDGCLKGRDVWITSLPCHIEVQDYGAWFRGSVTGHIIQVFDTGVTCNPATVNGIADKLRRQKLAFRLGIGAFERSKGLKSTDHRQWFSTLHEFSLIPGYRGVWIFPGGKQWDYLL